MKPKSTFDGPQTKKSHKHTRVMRQTTSTRNWHALRNHERIRAIAANTRTKSTRNAARALGYTQHIQSLHAKAHVHAQKLTLHALNEHAPYTMDKNCTVGPTHQDARRVVTERKS